MTALLASHAAARAQSPGAAASLPIGSSLTIISDETVDPRVRPGSEFRAHLRDPLILGETLVATAGTAARLVVIAKETGKDGSPSYRISITGLNLGQPGLLPVRPVTPTVDHIATGMAIPVTTQAALTFEQGKVRVALPLPFTLSNELPNSVYSPAPLRTAGPVFSNRRRGTPAPSPSPSASPSTMPGPPGQNPPPGSASTAPPLPSPT